MPRATSGTLVASAEKTIAVENAGAHYFFVPQGDYAAAKSTRPTPACTSIGVTTLSQVLADLRKLGGARAGALQRRPTKPFSLPPTS